MKLVLAAPRGSDAAASSAWYQHAAAAGLTSLEVPIDASGAADPPPNRTGPPTGFMSPAATLDLTNEAPDGDRPLLFERALPLAAARGAALLTVSPAHLCAGMAGRRSDDRLHQLRVTLLRLRFVAEEHGVRIGLLTGGRGLDAPQYALRDACVARDLVDDLATPWVGLVLQVECPGRDTAEAGIFEPGDAHDWLDVCGPRVAAIRMRLTDGADVSPVSSNVPQPPPAAILQSNRECGTDRTAVDSHALAGLPTSIDHERRSCGARPGLPDALRRTGFGGLVIAADAPPFSAAKRWVEWLRD